MKKIRLIAFTLMFGGIIILVIPPVSSYKGDARNKEVVKSLETKGKEDSLKNCKENGLELHQQEKSSQKDESRENNKEKDGTDNMPENLIGSLIIRKINAEYAVVEGAGKEELAYYIGHLPETAAIGAPGNCVLAGHNGGTNGTFFKHLDRLLEGDMVEITDLAGRHYVYTVAETYITGAYDNAVKNQGAERILTLITCSDNGKKRLAVKCRGEQEE